MGSSLVLMLRCCSCKQRVPDWQFGSCGPVNAAGKAGRFNSYNHRYGKRQDCLSCAAWRDRRSRRAGGRYGQVRCQAKNRGCLWELSREQFARLTNQPCVYCGGKLPEVGCGLDRKHSERRVYSIENVLPCCRACNSRLGAWPYLLKILWATAQELGGSGLTRIEIHEIHGRPSICFIPTTDLSCQYPSSPLSDSTLLLDDGSLTSIASVG